MIGPHLIMMKNYNFGMISERKFIIGQGIFISMNLQEHIRRVLKEETENLSPQDKLKQIILKDGWKRVSELLFGLNSNLTV